MTQPENEFTDSPGARVATPLLMGIVGPSGTGKTFSALRLATGMQRVTGGDIFFIDTESGRALHYAPLPGEKADPARGKFSFRHVPFKAPYGSLRYLAAIQYCVSKGAKVVVVDSMSHEHDGVGGMLEQHAHEAERLAKEYKSTVDAMKMSAWGVPKAGRRKLINTLMTDTNVNVIACFRAKQKVKLATKEERKGGVEAVTPMGFCAIAGEEFIFEMMLKCVLLPGARGVPTWESPYQGEEEMMKIPEQFAHVFERPAPLSEDIGQQLAEWAAGAAVTAPTEEDLAAGIAAAKAAKSAEEIGNIAESFRGKPWTATQRKSLKAALDGRKKELEASAAA
jgi:hypothetical protein